MNRSASLRLWRDATLLGNVGTGSSYTVRLLEPETSYTFALRVYGLRYDVYVNGVLSDVVFGDPLRKSVVYGAVGQSNRFDVIASDTAGNRAAPATLTMFID